MSKTAAPSESGPMLLPWTLVAILFAGLCAASGLAAVFFGLPYIGGAVTGVILGFFGSLFGGRYKTGSAALSVILATVVSSFIPPWYSFYALAPAFALLAGFELARYGSRVSVFAIMSWIILNSPTTAAAELGPLLLVFSASLAGGLVLAIILKVEGHVPPSDVQTGFAITHGFALAIGLVLAQLIASQFDNTHSHWIALLFAARALDPPGKQVAQARSRALAMVLGAAVASVLVLMPVESTWIKLFAVAFFVVGLRYLPSKGAVSPAMLSAGVILATSPTAETAVFRAEAAVLACALVVLVFFLARSVRRTFLGRPRT
ncbi:MAG: FUSC family protein [Pseudomonadota bacterium]